MQLNKIEVQGFKSFADKTEVAFLDGITTIVGPNGSGKSNILDAVKWVLGEQSIKNLRGSKMEDVIFAGTEARKKIGFAEVSMYLDNSDSSLPVEYKEVVVTRRVYRTGESNYLLNGTECRLKDIQELFMDTGIGKDGYSIISQGKIDEILSTKSEERRHIFEEASGIVKYRTRKEEATRKLESTKNSLDRITDILNEIKNTLAPLEKKAESAKQYLKLKEELKILDVKVFIDSLDRNSEELKKIQDVVDTFENDILSEQKNINQIEERKFEIKQQIQHLNEKIDENQNNYFELINQIERLNSKINLLKATIENSQDNIKRLESEITEDGQKISLLNEEMITKEEKRKKMSESKIKFETELLLKQEELDNIVKSLDERGIEIEKLKEENELLNEEKYELKVKNSSIDARIESNYKQITEKEKSEEKNISSKDSIVIDKEEIANILNNKKKQLQELQEKVASINTTIENTDRVLDEKYKECNRLNQDIMTCKSKYSYLVNLEKENEGYYKSVKSALEYSNRNNMNGVYGTVANVISTNEKYETAIEIALGSFVQNIIVQKDSDAKQIIEYLKENKLGRVTFLPLSSLKKVSYSINSKILKMQGFIGMAINLIDYDKKFYDAINLALCGVAIVDNIENALYISKEFKGSLKVVTLSGEVVSTTGSITGGTSLTKTNGLIGRIDKIKDLEKLISKKEEIYSEIKKDVETLKKEFSVISDNKENILGNINNLNIEIASITTKYENLSKELEKIEMSKTQSRELIDNLKTQNDILTLEISNNQKSIKEIDLKMNDNKTVIDEYARFNKEKQQTIDFLNEDIVNLKVSLSSFDESVASIDEMRDKIIVDISNFNAQIQRKKEQIINLDERIKSSNEELESLNDKILSQDTFKSDYLRDSEELKKNKEQYLLKEEELTKKSNESTNKIDRLKEEKSKIESKKIKFDIEICELKNKMWDEYELTISSSKKLLENYNFDDKNYKDIKNSADKVRKSIKELGDIDITSIEEYKNTKERFEFIQNQKLDLEDTKYKLENLINNMTSIMKQQFNKQFKIIAENFNETFRELFGGGKAQLRLSDDSDILNSGIEIEVQPPGKKFQSMMLLSGGERALTATALLFAILKIKSPPFCILDEIEAALDDVNVHRFAEYIKKYSKNTQFIVITHRKGTMEVASSVYGVTMQEYGVSKVVSMKLR